MDADRANTESAEVFPPEVLKRQLYRMYVLSNLFHSHFKMEIEYKDGISLVEWKIIESAFHSPGVSASDIIAFWGFDKTAASRSVIRLEKAGMLKREIASDDRRRYRLFLTDRGRRMYGKLQNFKENTFKEVESHLSGAELRRLGDSVEKMIDSMRHILAARGA